jgi:hypothetical protein
MACLEGRRATGLQRLHLSTLSVLCGRAVLMDRGFEDTDHAPELIGGYLREHTGELLAQLVRVAFRFNHKQFIELHP